MATPPDNEPVPEWVDEDPEIELTMEMEDEELEFEEFSGEEDELVAKARNNEAPRDYVPLWRLIEMSQEDRSLRLELADFEDYDDLDGHGSERAGLSH